MRGLCLANNASNACVKFSGVGIVDNVSVFQLVFLCSISSFETRRLKLDRWIAQNWPCFYLPVDLPAIQSHVYVYTYWMPISHECGQMHTPPFVLLVYNVHFPFMWFSEERKAKNHIRHQRQIHTAIVNWWK